MTFLIYKYENKINHKVYIGQTRTSLFQRAGSQGQKYKRCVLFWKAIEKYGWNNFEPTVLEEIQDDVDLANEREQYWIKFYDSTNPDKGYNLTTGGWAKKETTPLAREHMSIAQHNKPPISEETRQKLKNRDYSSISGENHYLYGKHLSEETKQKISDKLSDGKNPAARKVQCLETNEIFDTVSLASEWCNNGSPSLRSHIAAQIQGKRKSAGKHPITHEKLHWRYINENS